MVLCCSEQLWDESKHHTLCSFFMVQWKAYGFFMKWHIAVEISVSCHYVWQGQWYGCWRQVHIILVHAGLEHWATPVTHQPLPPDSLQTPHPGSGRAPAAFSLQLLSQPVPLQQRWLIVLSHTFLAAFALANSWIGQCQICKRLHRILS